MEQAGPHMLSGSFPPRAAHSKGRCGFLLAIALGVGLACAGDEPEPEPVYLSREQLMDPATCAGCHQKQYEQWASSMHAYASDDPLFLAMNARGQREGAIG